MNIASRMPDSTAAAIGRPRAGAPIFAIGGGASLVVRAGATIAGTAFPEPAEIRMPALDPGADYAVIPDAGALVAVPAADGIPAGAVGGFHYAPGGNAAARAGGDETPAINPGSIWDAGFRPACADPRGMALVERDGLAFWCDIYLLGIGHLAKGTSRFGETIADGADLPEITGGGRAKRFDFATAQAIYAHHGKRLLTYDEFRAAAFGVTEKTAHRGDPKRTGLDAARTSRFGIMQAAGSMWVWGTDGDPDEPRPSLFGGSWISGVSAGSRCANLDRWPGVSGDNLSARGRCDHSES